MLGEVIGTLVNIAANYIVLSTPEGRKKIPYREINTSYEGLTLQELLRKRVKITLWDKVTIKISSPKD